jgi:hypothetical protein
MSVKSGIQMDFEIYQQVLLMCDCVLDTSRSSPSRQDTINNEDRG